MINYLREVSCSSKRELSYVSFVSTIIEVRAKVNSVMVLDLSLLVANVTQGELLCLVVLVHIIQIFNLNHESPLPSPFLDFHFGCGLFETRPNLRRRRY